VMADPTSSKTTTISNMNHFRNITAKTRWTPNPHLWFSWGYQKQQPGPSKLHVPKKYWDW
jgi:hypothetical protein